MNDKQKTAIAKQAARLVVRSAIAHGELAALDRRHHDLSLLWMMYDMNEPQGEISDEMRKYILEGLDAEIVKLEARRRLLVEVIGKIETAAKAFAGEETGR